MDKSAHQVALGGKLPTTCFARHLVADECFDGQPASVDLLGSRQATYIHRFAFVPADMFRPLLVLVIHHG